MSKQETVKQKGSLNFSHYQKNQKQKEKILRSLKTMRKRMRVKFKSYILAMIKN